MELAPATGKTTQGEAPVPAHKPLVMVRVGQPSVFAHLRELYAHRELILSFTWRDIRGRYKQTALGIGWAILQPLLMMMVFTIVFSKFARVPSDGIPYPIFTYSALIFWTFFATTVTQGTIAMMANASLVRKIYFPRETLLLAVTLAAGLDFLFAALIFVGMLWYYQIALAWTALWVIPLLLVQILFTLGIVCVTSAIYVYYRDIGHALPLVIQLWIFATPVAYPLSLVPERLLPMYLLNPMASLIDGYRRVILLGEPPNLVHLGVGFGVALVVAGVAYLGFKRAERAFADVI